MICGGHRGESVTHSLESIIDLILLEVREFGRRSRHGKGGADDCKDNACDAVVESLWESSAVSQALLLLPSVDTRQALPE